MAPSHPAPRARTTRGPALKLHKADPKPAGGRPDRGGGRGHKGREGRADAPARRDGSAQGAPKTPARGAKRSRARSSGSAERQSGPRPERNGKTASAPEAGTGKVRVKMCPRPERNNKRQAHLIAVTRNNQGEDGQAAYCLAAVQLNKGCPAKLIRLVPGTGHFWNEAGAEVNGLPEEMRGIHEKPKDGISWEPQWQFRPIVVSYEKGSLPDAVTGPHRHDDVVTRNLKYVEPLEDNDELDEQLFRISTDQVEEVWPRYWWATKKSLKPEAEVTSLAVFRGRIQWIEWRPGASPRLHLQIGDTLIPEVPYAAHRLQGDKGYDALCWLKDHCECMFLLGLSRTFAKTGITPQCPILLLRVFPM